MIFEKLDGVNLHVISSVKALMEYIANMVVEIFNLHMIALIKALMEYISNMVSRIAGGNRKYCINYCRAESGSGRFGHSNGQETNMPYAHMPLPGNQAHVR